jgi:cytoskeletal protein CcmA (bactofilin family)
LTLGTIILLGVAGLLFIVPLWPALMELRAKRDDQPLRIAETYPEDHHIVARDFGDSVAARLEDAIHAFMASGGQPGTGATVLKDHYEVVGPDSDQNVDYQAGDLPLVLVQQQSRVWPAGMHLSRQVYVTGAFESGAGSLIDRLYVNGDLYLGEETATSKWAHARRDIRALAGCDLEGSISAGRLLQVWPGCRFERLEGAEIRFGDEWHWPEGPVPTLHQPLDLPPLFRLNGRSRRLGTGHHIAGNLVIPAGHVWTGDLIVQGKLRLARGARVEGSIKAEDAVLLEAGASVVGQLFSGSSIEIRSGARVTGTAATEGELRVRWGAEIGSADTPSTATGRRILMDQGARVFGVVMATQEGKVALRTVARHAA